jgi:3'-phosphoadenosine 5'-phosphosulfate sulfotransferase (PAPS reductase)/FAD synthetase
MAAPRRKKKAALPQVDLFAEPTTPDRGVLTTPEIDDLLAFNAPVAIGASGGKDSCLAAFAVQRHLDKIGHTGPRILVHADLGRVEWKDSLPTCERLADRLGLELVIVRRKSGDMMDRWLSRWAANVTRYQDLSCVKLISPWSSSAMRFCTSELKVQPICRELIRRFPNTTIINAVGIRREESAGRQKSPVAKIQNALTSRTTRGYNWNAVLHYLKPDVFARLEAENFTVHEGYRLFGMDRISCAFCIMGSAADLWASSTCEQNADIYREMVDLEIASTFSFQDKHWLADVAPHLLTAQQREELSAVKHCADVRRKEEARIPDHLLFEEGWPRVMPTQAEAELLCDVRLKVAVAVGISDMNCLDADTLIARYQELMNEHTGEKP